ncbi:dephospho-CoA kinase [Candidatus Marinamargulisbacteria bacterium SCGC AG-439-L15]|nr:dephospho-CoA kinase [Candidatus Marinamargulisbacteria bacterium SCGC AG-439-L15]
MVKVVGVTGRAGSGKSFAVALLSKRFDVEVIDLDKVGHQALLDPTCLKRILGVFGKDILSDGRTIDRLKLGHIVFSDDKKRAELNVIVHPWMKAYVEKKLQDVKSSCIIVGALITEIGLRPLCDSLLFIDATDSDIKTYVGENKYRIAALQRSRDDYRSDCTISIENRYDDTFSDELESVFDTILKGEPF